ncbi:MAG: hypothetical protein KDD41_00300 [Flavobacteriales bacterium]|nr:hypothetical protein [Flavobacteriales bacterium]
MISKTAILKWKISNSGELEFTICNKEYLLKNPTEVSYGFRKNQVKGMVYQYRLYAVIKSNQLDEPLILTEELPAGRSIPDNWEEIYEIPPSTKVYGNSNGFMLRKSGLPDIIELLKN